MKKVTTALALVGGLLALAGCGGDDTKGDGRLTIYSGREEELVAPLFDKFEKQTGTEVEVRYGDSAELAAAIAEESDNSPADVFFAQDPGSLGALEKQLAELPDSALEPVPARYRDEDGRWVGTSGRVRVIAYNTDALSEEEVPDSVFELVDPKWNGKVGVAPTNASFQAFVSAMRLSQGEQKTRKWLEDLKDNDVKFYEKNLPIVEAVASGEIELGLVNHYYLYVAKQEKPDAAVANHFLTGTDPGALVSVAGAGVLEQADDKSEAERFVEFLLSEDGAALLHRGGRGGRVPARRRHRPQEGAASAHLAERPGPRPFQARR